MIAHQDDAGTLVAVLDGVGSWGGGIAAAVWVRSQLDACWAEPGSLSPAGMRSDIEEAVGRLPAEVRDPRRDERGDWRFSLVAVLILGRRLHWVGAGALGLSLVRRDAHQRLFKSRMLVDDLGASGRWGPRRLARFPHAHVVTGALIGDRQGRDPEHGGPTMLEPGDRVVLAHERVQRELLPANLHDSAEALQDAAIFASLRPTGVAIIDVHDPS